jgi:tryptophan-rich sensory protein
MNPARQVIALAVSVAICLSAAGLGSILNIPNLRSWYPHLQKPSWTPPNWIFAPVWTALYLSMSVAAWLVWRQEGSSRTRLPLTLFFIQLALNVLWSGLFFRLRLPGIAFLEVVLLWAFILCTVIAFRPVSQAASWLMVPYLCWVTFAATLNAAIWKMNT